MVQEISGCSDCSELNSEHDNSEQLDSHSDLGGSLRTPPPQSELGILVVCSDSVPCRSKTDNAL